MPQSTAGLCPASVAASAAYCLSRVCCGCEQGLRRMLLFGFQADARTLQEVPAVSQVLPALAAFASSKYLTKRVSGRTAV